MQSSTIVFLLMVCGRRLGWEYPYPVVPGFPRCHLPFGTDKVEQLIFQKMLQDPDNYEDVAIEITAQNDIEAQLKGEQLAALRSDEQTIVQCLGCRRRTRTTGKYVCTLRIESRSLPQGDTP